MERSCNCRIDRLSNHTSAKILSLIPIVNNIVLTIKHNRLNKALADGQVLDIKKIELLNNMDNFCATIKKYQYVQILVSVVSAFLIIPGFVLIPSYLFLSAQEKQSSKMILKVISDKKLAGSLDCINQQSAIRNKLHVISTVLESLKYTFESNSARKDLNLDKEITTLNTNVEDVQVLIDDFLPELELVSHIEKIQNEFKAHLDVLHKVKKVCEIIKNNKLSTDNLSKMTLELIRPDMLKLVQEVSNELYSY
jgi:hypothetical protein